MTLSAVAKRYANALADVVTASGSPLRPQDAVTELTAFAAALGASAELANALVSPAVPAGRKRAVVERIGQVLRLSRISKNFLFVLIDHRRIASLSEVVYSFELMLEERLGIARSEVTSARELSEAQRAAIRAELERVTGKRMRMDFRVDANLIGGAVARIGSTVYNGSVSGQLASLGNRLSAEE